MATDTGGGAGLFPDPGNYRPVNMPSVALSQDQIRMDVLVKLQTELMLTSLTCHNYYNNPDLYRSYAQWTVVNQALLNQVQNDMGRFLGAHRSGSNARVFDTYRTKMANDESAIVNRIGASAYCRARRDQYLTATSYTPAQLNTYLDQLVQMYSPRYTLEARQPGAALVAITPPAGSPPIVAAAPAPAPTPAAAAPAATAVAAAPPPAAPTAPTPTPSPVVAATPAAADTVAAVPVAAGLQGGQQTVLPIPPREPVPVVPPPRRRPG